jgi:hypothetical protein
MVRREVHDRDHRIAVHEHVVGADVAVHDLPGQAGDLRQGTFQVAECGRDHGVGLRRAVAEQQAGKLIDPLTSDPAIVRSGVAWRIPAAPSTRAAFS